MLFSLLLPFITLALNGADAPLYLRYPNGMGVIGEDNLLVADSNRNIIVKVDKTGIAVRIAGDGRQGYTGNHQRAKRSSLNQPSDVLVAPDGSFYIADTNNHRIRHVINGQMDTVVGNGRSPQQNQNSNIDGSSFALGEVTNLGQNETGSIYFSEFRPCRICALRPSGKVEILADEKVLRRISGERAMSAYIKGFAVGRQGDVFFSLYGSPNIFKLRPDCQISTFASNPSEDFRQLRWQWIVTVA